MSALMGSVPFMLGAPVVFVGILSTVSPTAANLLNKVFFFFRAFLHMILTTEGSYSKALKKLPDPAIIKNQPTEKINVIFVRHCESTWNEVFNKGSGVARFAMMPLRFARAIFIELTTWHTGGSIFLDSPLSREGLAQARSLLAFVEGKTDTENQSASVEKHVRILRGEGKSILVSSNLQRALETMTIGFWGRLQRSGEKVLVNSDLQEISRNIDTMSLSNPRSLPPLLSLGAALEYPTFEAHKRFEVSDNKGQKEIFACAMDRITRFASWCFASKEAQGNVIIVGGHSLYFKTFFQAYMDRNEEHVAKKKKIVNAGVVAFVLERGNVDGMDVFRIDPSSIEVVTGGFK